jgi:integrase
MVDRGDVKSLSSPLHEHAVAPRTRSMYLKAVWNFCRYLVASGWFEDEPKTLDLTLAEYFNALYRRGLPQYWAVHCLHGVRHFFPSMGANLPTALRSLKGWQRLHPSKARPVMPREVAYTVAMLMYRKYKQWDAAVMTLVCFDCYLRVSEMVGVRARDLVNMRGREVVKLPATKTGPDQGVTIRSGIVALLARRLARQREPQDRLLSSGSAPRYRALFYQCIEDLRLQRVGFTPHSMRHGGATHDFHYGGLTVEEVLLRGRWRTTKSARHYIRSLPALLAKVPIPQAILDFGQRVENNLEDCFDRR